LSGELIFAKPISWNYIRCKRNSRAYNRLFLNAEEFVIAAFCQLIPSIEGHDLQRLIDEFAWEDATIALGSIVFLLYTISSIHCRLGTDLLENIFNPYINRKLCFVQFLPCFFGFQ